MTEPIETFRGAVWEQTGRGPNELCIRWDIYGRHLATTIEQSVLGVDVDLSLPLLLQLSRSLCFLAASHCSGRRASRTDKPVLEID